MKKKILSIFNKKYRVHWTIAVAVVAIAGFIFLKGGDEVETLIVHPGDFLQQVSVSGKIVATEVLDLSFEQTGQVRRVYVKEGNTVKAGQLLASQDTLQLSAQLSETQAGIDLQEAKLQQLLSGASAEDIKVSENKVTSAQQDLDNAYDDTLTVLERSYNDIYNANNVALSIQNSYFSSADQQGIKVIISKEKIQESMVDSKSYLEKAKDNQNDKNINLAIENMISNLNTVYNNLSIIRSQCDEGIYYSKVSSTDKSSLDTQKTKMNTAIDDLKSSKQDILDYKIDLDQAKNELALKKAPPREADIAVFRAQIEQAKSSKQNILAQLAKKQIYSPIDGTVTNVNAKLGSIASASEAAISIISSDRLQIESYIPEIYISLLEIGDLSSVTLDAYGSEVIFEAKVVSINPAETIKEGVPTYKTKLQFTKHDERVKSGMTANVVITTDSKTNVISIPQGVVINRDGKKFVKVQEGKEVVEKEVQTGIISSLGKIEILSGLKDGDVVVVK